MAASTRTGSLALPLAGCVTDNLGGSPSSSVVTRVTVTLPVVGSGVPGETVSVGGVLSFTVIVVWTASWPASPKSPKDSALSSPAGPWTWGLVSSLALMVTVSVPVSPALGVYVKLCPSGLRVTLPLAPSVAEYSSASPSTSRSFRLIVMLPNASGFDAVAVQRYPELEQVNHVHHAGNSSGIVDGAAAVLLGSKKAGKAMGLKPRARIRAFANIGSEPAIMLTGPVDVTEKLLKRAKMKLKDIDLFELNEAFASVVLRYMQAFEIDHDKINVNGGAIAMGHPLGATGAMIFGTVLDELERRDLNTALVTLCIGAGMGTATIIERF